VKKKGEKMAGRKRDEVFNIKVRFKNRTIGLTVKADYPAGPECLGCDYDIYEGRKHLYTLNQCKNEDKVECWEIKKRSNKDLDPGFAELIGKAIDKHYRD
jgi:hypothetical protein